MVNSDKVKKKTAKAKKKTAVKEKSKKKVAKKIKLKKAAKPWFLYLIRCADNSLYAGISTDVERRFTEHQQGAPKGAKYLRGRGPLSLLWQQKIGDRAHATRVEIYVKALSKIEKEALVVGKASLGGLLGDKLLVPKKA